jgi:hypothetical protein
MARRVDRQARSHAATWFEQLKDLDRSLGAATTARAIVQLCEAREAHMRQMPPAASVYGFSGAVSAR